MARAMAAHRQRVVPAHRGAPARAATSRSRASGSPRRSARARPRSCSPPAAPRATTSRSRACTGRAAAPIPAASACWSRPSSTTRSSIPPSGSCEHEGADARAAAGRRRRPGAARRAARGDRARRRRPWRWSRSCGPTTRSARSTRSASWPRSPTSSTSRCTPTPCRPSGILPVDFAASGVDALTLTGHKLGGPYGAGALLLGRDRRSAPRCCTAAGRSATCAPARSTPPAVVGLATAVELAVADAPAPRRDARRAARRSGRRRCCAAVPDATLNGDPGTATIDGGPSRLPGNAHLSFPGCEGDSLLMLLDAHGHRVLDGLGLHRGRRAAQPRAAGDGRRRGHRPRLAAVLPRATPPPRPTSTRWPR